MAAGPDTEISSVSAATLVRVPSGLFINTTSNEPLAPGSVLEFSAWITRPARQGVGTPRLAARTSRTMPANRPHRARPRPNAAVGVPSGREQPQTIPGGLECVGAGSPPDQRQLEFPASDN